MRSSGSRDTRTDREVAGIIARLLLHFWAPGELSDVARAAMAQDWLEDLREFGPACVANACQEWRREQENRPKPANIRKLCIEAQAAQRERLAHASYSDGDGYARSVGWASEAERREAIRRDVAQREARYEQARLVREEMEATGRGHAYRATAATLRANAVWVREEDPEELRKARVALGIEEPEPPQEPQTAMAAE